jgi:hypothetical protein
MNVRTASFAAGLVVAGLAVTTGSAAAEAPSNGCPRGYDLLLVAELTDLGYGVPAKIDDPGSGLLSYGRPGNDNGWVCAVAMGNQIAGNGHQLYNFMDDSLRVP